MGGRYWQKEARAELPRPWGEPPDDRRLGSDGAEYALRARLVAFDPLEQQTTYEIRAWMWRDGELVAEEEHRLDMTLYFTHEIELMLELAGFVDIELRAGYADRAADRRRRLRRLHREEAPPCLAPGSPR